MPFATVIIRTYNSEAFVADALKSVFAQTVEANIYEILVVDDGSTDNTILTVKRLGKDRVKVIQHEHIGAVPALNVALQNVSTPYILFLDSDDTLKPSCLEELYAAVTNTSIAFVYSDYLEYRVNGSKKILYTKNNVFDCVLGGVLFDRKKILEVGQFEDTFIFPEYDMFIKLMKRYKSAHVSNPLYCYRRKSRSITMDQNVVKRGIEQIIKKYGQQYPIRKY